MTKPRIGDEPSSYDEILRQHVLQTVLGIQNRFDIQEANTETAHASMAQPDPQADASFWQCFEFDPAIDHAVET